MALKLEILSPNGNLFSGEVESVHLPGSYIPFEVLKGHAPIISSLSKGEIRLTTSQGEAKSISISGGFAKVKNDIVTVCVE